MTNEELIRILQKYPKDANVLISTKKDFIVGVGRFTYLTANISNLEFVKDINSTILLNIKDIDID